MSYSDLPHIFNFKNPDYCRPGCNCSKCKKIQEEEKQDPRLVNWETWVKRRYEVGEKIQKVIKRKPNNLLMNTDDNFRNIKEMKLMFNNANIPVPRKNYGAYPGFFKMPDSLPKIGCEEETYYRQLDKEEKGILTEVEFMGKSNFIRNLTGIESTRKSNWDKNEYCQKKLRSKAMRSLHYFRPDLSALALIGNNLEHKNKYTRTLEPLIEGSLVSSVQCDDSTKIATPLLFLNKIPVNTNESKNIRIIFMDCTRPEILVIENHSKYALRFYFKQEEQSFYLVPKSTQTSVDQVFFFNKNIHIIQPHEKLEFPFWVNLNQKKSHSETYEMIISPSLFKRINVILQANSCDCNDFYERCLGVMNKLEVQARNRVVKEVLEDLIPKITGVPKIIRYKYDKAMIFEAVNSKYSYDKKVVGWLEKFYEKIRLDVHPEYWDYKIGTLRAVVGERELFDQKLGLEADFEVIKKKIIEAGVAREELKTKKFIIPKKESKKVNKPTNKPGKKNQKVIEEEKKIVSLREELEGIIGELTCVNKRGHKDTSVVKMLTNLFSACIDKIVEDISELEANLGIKTLVPKLRHQISKYNREKADVYSSGCTMFSKPFYNWIKNELHQPSPQWTSEIPLEDYKQRYKAFHSVSEVSKKSANKNKKRAANTPTTLTSRNSSSSTNHRKKSLSKEASLDLISDDDLQSFRKYAENTYIIFYTNLCRFFEDFGVIQEMFLESLEPRLKVIQKLEEDVGDVIKTDSNIEVRIFDLKRAISEALGTPRGLTQGKLEDDKNYVDVSDSTSSVWSILDVYKKKDLRLKPRYEGDVYYTLKTKEATTVETATSVIQFEEDLDKSVQVEICGSEDVEVVTSEETGIEEELCKCSDSITSISMNIGYYDSCADFEKSVSTSEEEVKSCKSSDT